MAHLVPVQYISIWDGDEIITNAQVNLQTGEVVSIEAVDISNEYNSCEGEFVEYLSGDREKVVASQGSYFLLSTFRNSLLDILDAVLADLKMFDSEGYPNYQEQVQKARKGDSGDFYALLEVADSLLGDLEEFHSENAPIYRQKIMELENRMDD